MNCKLSKPAGKKTSTSIELEAKMTEALLIFLLAYYAEPAGLWQLVAENAKRVYHLGPVERRRALVKHKNDCTSGHIGATLDLPVDRVQFGRFFHRRT